MTPSERNEKRFQAAAAAMTGLLSSACSCWKPEILAEVALEYADALLAEMEKPEKEVH